MIEFLKKNLIIIGLFIITLFVGFFTFLTFIDKSFIQLNQSNLQYLLISKHYINYFTLCICLP
jgi:two-component system nitrogen regulation sensor histidine kinase NtrY